LIFTTPLYAMDSGSIETNTVSDKGKIVSTVEVLVPSSYSIIIPKKIILEGSDKRADYTVRVTGDLPANETISVEPDTTDFVLSQAGRDDIIPTLIQKVTEFRISDSKKDSCASGIVTAKGLSLGSWNGSFIFNIENRISDSDSCKNNPSSEKNTEKYRG
ncbi:MAG: hypothetical protein K5931_03360, partial [Lachnospiraceae bacterium]|nr:hypothetical protein [Lachnospiraceae bacterium]